MEQIRDGVRGVYLVGYDLDIARWLCSGVDLWLNTPQKPLEASGTSGMKAAMNGVPSLSVLDGWWIEGHVEGVTGWSIGSEFDAESAPGDEADDIYHKLEFQILPTYYRRPERYDRIRRASISLNGSFFNTQRMLVQYLQNAYRILRRV
jgi:starch phosphorylase